MEQELPYIDLLLDLENRHDDLLRRLDDLDRRVVGVLTQCQARRAPIESPEPQVARAPSRLN